MKTALLRPFESIPYFSIEAFRQASGIESPHTARVLLHRWARAGHILALKKGLYMTRRFYEAHRADGAFPLAISAVLLPQSYVSLEFILQRHNLLTEVTYPVTCITPKNTRAITNRLGTFWFRHIRPDLYTGFTIEEYFGIRYGCASLGKALFDYLYLRPLPPAIYRQTINLAEEVRLNLDEMDDSAWQEFERHVEAGRSRKMRAVFENLRRRP